MSDERLRGLEREARDPERLARLAVEYERAGNHRLAVRTALTAASEGCDDPGIADLKSATGCIVLADERTLDAYFMDTKLARIDIGRLIGKDSTTIDYAYRDNATSILTEINGHYTLHTVYSNGTLLSEELPIRPERPTRLIPLLARAQCGIVWGSNIGGTLQSHDGDDIEFPPPYPLARHPLFDLTLGFTRQEENIKWKAYANTNDNLTIKFGYFNSLFTIDGTISLENDAVSSAQEEQQPDDLLWIRRNMHNTTERAQFCIPTTERYGLNIPQGTRLQNHKTTCANEHNLATLWNKNAKRTLLETPLAAIEGLLTAYERGAR